MKVSPSLIKSNNTFLEFINDLFQIESVSKSGQVTLLPRNAVLEILENKKRLWDETNKTYHGLIKEFENLTISR